MSEDPTGKLPSSKEDDGYAQVLTAVKSIDVRLGGIETKLEGLEKKVEERLYDTRPIWETVQTDITHLKEGQKNLEHGMEALRDEMRTGFRNLKRQFSILNDTFLEVRADYKDLDKRLYRMEPESN